MNRSVFSTAALFGALAFLTSTAQAQTWQTVDDYTNGTFGLIALGVTCDATGGVYVVGTRIGRQSALVRYSGDEGFSWSNVDDFNYTPAGWSVLRSVHVDKRGYVFTAGECRGASPAQPDVWIVRRSLDHGRTWTTVDTASPFANASAAAITSDANGILYAVGSCENGWLVRRSADGGYSWQTGGGVPGLYPGAAVCSATNLYVVARPSLNAASSIWGSSDRGGSWVEVPSSLGLATSDSGAYLVADAAGNLYETGSDGKNYALCEGRPDGTGWAIIDYYSSPSPASWASGRALAIDLMGNIYVTGNVVFDADPPIWAVRQFSRLTGQWNTTDVFTLAQGSLPNGIACDPWGNVYCVGSQPVGGDWIVRKLSVATPAPTLQLTVLGNALSLSWPASANGFTLEASGTLGPSALWSPFAATPQTVGTQHVVTIGMTNSAQFFRLKH